MTHKAPVDVAACGNDRIEGIDEILAVIFTCFRPVAVPLLIHADVNIRIRISAFDRIITDTESFRIFIYISILNLDNRIMFWILL